MTKFQEKETIEATLPPPANPAGQSGDKEKLAGGETAGKWAVLAITAIGVFMACLDSSIVNINLPTIAHYFGVPLSGSIEWVVIAYLVATAAILLTAGRLADMIGRKVIWLSGLIIFTTGSALCGAAPSLGFLIAARAFQGLGGALLMAVSLVMLTNAFPAHERGRAVGLNSLIVSLGVSVGPTIGGFIAHYASWRWIFYVNIPFGIIGLIATFTVLTERLRRSQGRFDPAGAFLLAIGLASLTAALSFGAELGWSSPWILGGFLLGIVAMTILPFVEARVANPIIVISLLRNRVFASAIVTLVLSFLSLFAVSFMLPFYLEELRGFPPQQAGLLLTPFPLIMGAVAPFSGRLADKVGTRWLAALGLTIACAGLILLSMLTAESSIIDIIWRLTVTGLGMALFQSPNNSALLGSAPPALRGSASGFLATGRVVGQSLSIAMTGAVFTGLGGATAGQLLSNSRDSGGGIKVPDMSAVIQTFEHSFQLTFLVCAAIAAVGIITSLVRGKEG